MADPNKTGDENALEGSPRPPQKRAKHTLRYFLLLVIDESGGGNTAGAYVLDADKLELPNSGPSHIYKEHLWGVEKMDTSDYHYNEYEDIQHPNNKRFKEVLNKVLDDLNTYTTPFEDLPAGSRHLQTVTFDGGHRGRWGLRDV